MAFSTAFEPAGKYVGLSGFPTGFSLEENLTTPLNQQVSGNSGSPLNPYDNSSEMGMLLNYIENLNKPERREQELKAKLAYDKEQMKQAFPYLMAREIPRQISEGFANRAALTVLGARSGAEAMAQTLNAYPRVSLATVPFQPQKYFSQNKMNYWSGGSSFSGIPSWSDSFNTKLPSSLSSSANTQGNSSMWPLALAGVGSSIFGGLLGASSAADTARMQNQMQNAAILEGREQTKAGLGSNIFNQLFAAGTGGDISFEREKAAKKFMTGPYAERLMGLGSEQSKRDRLAAISPESKALRQEENKLAIEREIAARRAQTDAMFGPISSSYKAQKQSWEQK